MREPLDVTISRCEGDLSLTIAVGDWFPTDEQMEVLNRTVGTLVACMLPDEPHEPPFRN